jgi:hypothetical protein
MLRGAAQKRPEEQKQTFETAADTLESLTAKASRIANPAQVFPLLFRLQMTLNRPQKAIRCLEAWLEADPDSPAAGRIRETIAKLKAEQTSSDGSKKAGSD